VPYLLWHRTSLFPVSSDTHKNELFPLVILDVCVYNIYVEKRKKAPSLPLHSQCIEITFVVFLVGSKEILFALIEWRGTFVTKTSGTRILPTSCTTTRSVVRNCSTLEDIVSVECCVSII
jgi:hypothetical protein